tara:strand:- start:578 stop:1009 length:432 start_codon:yes stop_codon:yes gene_type:complete
MREITKIVLHCSATREGRDYSVETIRSWHTKKGWRDIGYHYVIQRNGDIQEGRPVAMQGAHVRGHNKNSIGICYIGGVEATRNSLGKWVAKDTRTIEQKASLDSFISSLMSKYPKATLHGHNEFSAKACPSFDVQKEYKHLIK